MVLSVEVVVEDGRVLEGVVAREIGLDADKE